MKFFDHDGERWMEGTHEGRWFALEEYGERLVIETTLVGFSCYTGAVAEDAFTGERVGVLSRGQDAMRWLYGTLDIDPWRIDRPGASRITVSVVSDAVEA